MGSKKPVAESGSPEAAFIGTPKKITELLATESDRGVILVLAAYLEEILALIVRAACVSDAIGGELVKNRRPAGDFDSKILLCSAFALISGDESGALDTMRKIRNRAAHFDPYGRGFDVLFDSPQTADQIAHLCGILNIELKSRESAAVRTTFILVGRLLATRLFVRLSEVKRPTAAKTLKEAANAIREQSKGTPMGEAMNQAEEESRAGRPEKLFDMMDSMMEAIARSVAAQLSEISPDDTDSPTEKQ